MEASYSLTFHCSKGVTMMEEQFFIMKPKEVVTRSFRIDPTTDQAAKYACSAILKDSEYNEVDRAECQFTTTATVLDNGTQGTPFLPPKSDRKGFFESIGELWNNFWAGLSDFITGKTCRSKCSGFFDFNCHMQYVCMSWIVMFGLFLSIFPTVLVLLWLLHQKGLFDPLYDWWEDHCWHSNRRHKNPKRHGVDIDHHRKRQAHHHRHRRNHVDHHDHGHRHAHRLHDYERQLHHVHKDKHKHGRHRSGGVLKQMHLEGDEEEGGIQHHRNRKERKAIKRASRLRKHNREYEHVLYVDEHRRLKEDGRHKLLIKRRE